MAVNASYTAIIEKKKQSLNYSTDILRFHTNLRLRVPVNKLTILTIKDNVATNSPTIVKNYFCK